jgi:hypothetical protein
LHRGRPQTPLPRAQVPPLLRAQVPLLPFGRPPWDGNKSQPRN